MERITIEEFEERKTKFAKVVHKGATKENNKTRKGEYFTLLKGLLSECWFVGTDLESNETIAERVG